MTHPRPTTRPGWWRLLLAAIAALVVGLPGAGTASATTLTGAETRVGASTPPAAYIVGVHESVSAGQRWGNAPPTAQIVSATGVAANTGTRLAQDIAAKAEMPLIKAGAEGGETAGKAFSQKVRQEVLAENPSTCVYCRMETDRPQVDHVIPRSRGGNATVENGQTTCPWCNPSKGARDFPVNPPPGFEGPWPPAWWPSG